MKKNKEGISLISLIITIIVIIILAAIVIFTGLGTPDSANFAKYASEFSDFGMAITNDYMNRKAEYAINGQTRSDKQIYYMIASGTEIDMNDPVTPVGTIEELGLNIMPEEIYGTEYYEITSDKNVENWQNEKQYYEKNEKHYVTDEGEAFVLPGYLQEDNGIKKWWVNERKYYVSETPVSGTEKFSLSNTLKVGDYVDYIPDSSTYITDTNNTGHPSAQTLTTQVADWRVLYVNESTGEVLITTNGIVNSGTYLRGTKGYFRGPTELNNICAALYSNSSLGITARSMTVEDLNKACSYMPTTSTTRYAFYPYGTTFAEGDTEIEYDGKIYKKEAHTSNTAVFYTSDGGGAEKTDSDGFVYREPETDNPVYVTMTGRSYNPSLKNETVGSILGSGYGWLASQCVHVYFSKAYFIVRYAYSTSVTGFYLYHSDGYGGSNSGSRGIRPLVSLDSRFRVDNSDLSRDGSTAEKAWKLIKK